MSERRRRTWLEIEYRKAYEQGKRQGYSKGLAEGMIESISEGLARRLGQVLQEVMAENLLHCLEKGRVDGLRLALAEFTRIRFGEESEDKFKELTKSLESPSALERMFEPALWSKDEEDWMERAKRLIAEEEAEQEAEGASAPSN